MRGMPGANRERYLTVAEAARRLRASVVTVRRRIRSGRLRAYRNGRLLRIREADLSATNREAVGWGNLSADCFLHDWDNPYDAVYDSWRRRGATRAR
jgi:excisionase family DNA binding protein